jgi:hypothetical protein
LPFFRFSKNHEKTFHLNNSDLPEVRPPSKSLAILCVNKQLYREAREIILENKTRHLNLNKLTRQAGFDAKGRFQHAFAIDTIHEVFSTRNLHCTVVLMPSFLRTKLGKLDYTYLHLLLNMFSENREKYQKFMSRMRIEITVACEPCSTREVICQTADAAFDHAKEPGVEVEVRIAASKVCDEARRRFQEMGRYLIMLEDAKKEFERWGIDARIVDVTKEPWF